MFSFLKLCGIKEQEMPESHNDNSSQLSSLVKIHVFNFSFLVVNTVVAFLLAKLFLSAMMTRIK